MSAATTRRSRIRSAHCRPAGRHGLRRPAGRRAGRESRDPAGQVDRLRSELGVVNTVASTDAHTTSVEVDGDGNVAVTYDYRFNDVNSNDGLETAHWIRRSTDGGASFGADEMLGTTFDARKAPYALGYF